MRAHILARAEPGVHAQKKTFGARPRAFYTFRPRLWLAGDATFYTGGRTRVDGIAKADRQRNSRVGLTLALPTGRHHSLKLAWATGFTTRIGGDFDTLAIGWHVLWFDRH